MPELEVAAAPDLAGRHRRRLDVAGDGRPRKAQRRARRRRDERLRRARGEARRGADALPGALDPAAGDRQPLARAPLRHGLPARGDPPARLRPDRPPRRLQKRGLRDVRGADALDLGGIQQARLPRRDRSRPGAVGRGLRRQRRRRRADRARLLRRHARRPAFGPAAGRRRRRQPAASKAVGRGRRPRRRSATAPPSRSRPWSRTSTTRIGRNDPAGAGPARSTRSATAPEGAAGTRRFALRRRPTTLDGPVREFIRAFNERDLDAFVAVLDPEVELHSMRGLRQGASRRRDSGRRGRRAGCSRRSSSSSSTRTGPRGRRRRGRADPSAAGTGKRTARRRAPTRWPGCSSCATTGFSAGGPFEDRAEALRAAGFARRRTQSARYHRWRGPSQQPTRRRPTPGAGRSSSASPGSATWSTAGLGAHGEAAMARPSAAAGRPGASTSAAVSATRPSGSPGWSARRARRSASTSPSPSSSRPARRPRAGRTNVSFAVADVQVGELGEGFDYAFSRMGMMFFANPVQALRNIRSALAPGGRLCAVVWRRKDDNEWMRRAELVVEEYLDRPEETDEPTCGPGPFSMANADTVSEQLTIAGFEEITLQRCDLPLKIGHDLDHAVEFNMALGPGRRGAAPLGRPDRRDPAEDRRATCARRWPSSTAPTASSPRPRPGSSAQPRNLGRPESHGRRRAERVRCPAPGRCPRAAVPALGLPLTRLRSSPRSSASRPRCSGPASGTTRRPPRAPPPPTPAPSAS